MRLKADSLNSFAFMFLIAAVMAVALSGCAAKQGVQTPQAQQQQQPQPTASQETQKCSKDADCRVIECFKAPCPENKCINGGCVIVQPSQAAGQQAQAQPEGTADADKQLYNDSLDESFDEIEQVY
ncbi:hypothetical protein HYV82_03335 [Candidatus Woesearchaeota archaeon]|nr:hypothetical protein [Candidatus Woesearchaeota archaeon]